MNFSVAIQPGWVSGSALRLLSLRIFVILWSQFICDREWPGLNDTPYFSPFMSMGWGVRGATGFSSEENECPNAGVFTGPALLFGQTQTGEASSLKLMVSKK
jgi:hypothetical protein